MQACTSSENFRLQHLTVPPMSLKNIFMPTVVTEQSNDKSGIQTQTSTPNRSESIDRLEYTCTNKCSIIQLSEMDLCF